MCSQTHPACCRIAPLLCLQGVNPAQQQQAAHSVLLPPLMTRDSFLLCNKGAELEMGNVHPVLVDVRDRTQRALATP